MTWGRVLLGVLADSYKVNVPTSPRRRLESSVLSCPGHMALGWPEPGWLLLAVTAAATQFSCAAEDCLVPGRCSKMGQPFTEALFLPPGKKGSLSRANPPMLNRNDQDLCSAILAWLVMYSLRRQG
jgi:hypothetical protein